MASVTHRGDAYACIMLKVMLGLLGIALGGSSALAQKYSVVGVPVTASDGLSINPPRDWNPESPTLPHPFFCSNGEMVGTREYLFNDRLSYQPYILTPEGKITFLGTPWRDAKVQRADAIGLLPDDDLFGTATDPDKSLNAFVIWTKTGECRILKPFNREASYQFLSRNHRTVVFEVRRTVQGSTAVLWNPSKPDETLDLHLPPDTQSVIAMSINSEGTIAGVIQKRSGTRQFVRWVKGVCTPLEMPEENETGGLQVMASGAVLGTVSVLNPDTKKRLGQVWQWASNEIIGHEIKTVGLPEPDGWTMSFLGSNQKDTLVGYAVKGRVFRAIRWRDGDKIGHVLETPVPFGVQANELCSVASAVNDSGMIVGFCYGTRGGEIRALLWDPQGVATNLNAQIPPDTGWNLLRPCAIDEKGRIAGVAAENKMGPLHLRMQLHSPN